MLTVFTFSPEEHYHLYDLDHKRKKDNGSGDRERVVWQGRGPSISDKSRDNIGEAIPIVDRCAVTFQITNI